MRWTRFRFSVRGLMVLVLLTALMVEVELIRRRSAYCSMNARNCALAVLAHQRMAEGHERIAQLYRHHAADPRESVRYNTEQAASFARHAEGERAEARRANQRREAFRWAAILPWLTIPAREDDPIGVRAIEHEQRLQKDAQAEASNALPALVRKPR